MIKDDLTFTNMFGDEKTVEVRFHLTKTELGENALLLEQFQEIRNLIGDDPQGEMETTTVVKMLGLIKNLMGVSYGRKVGDRFVKNQEQWDEFVETGSYDAMLFHLFEDPERANDFMVSLMPADMREEVTKELEAQGELNAPLLSEQAPAEEDTRPAWVRENRKPNKKEQMNMSREELLEAMRALD